MTDTFRDRDILRRIPTPAVLHYTATAAPVPAAGGDGLDLTGHGVDAPVDVPAVAEWPTSAPGTEHACALLPAGVYLVASSWQARGTDLAGVDAYVCPLDDDAVTVWAVTGEQTRMLVATAPVRLYAATGATNDDAGRSVDFDLWVTRVGAL